MIVTLKMSFTKDYRTHALICDLYGVAFDFFFNSLDYIVFNYYISLLLCNTLKECGFHTILLMKNEPRSRSDSDV